MLKSAIGTLNKAALPGCCMTSCSRGFTLLELMVVLFIIGIIIGAATLSVDTRDEDIATEARRFAALVELASDEAVLKAEEYAVQFDPEGYGFTAFTENGWAEMEDIEIFRRRKLPDGLDVELFLEGERVDIDPDGFFDEEDEDRNRPRIYLLSSGEVTPFEYILQDAFSPTGYLVKGDSLDGISVASLTEQID
ncbi:type II secretion system minor pseudopilin GspH [Thermodesulfobacteriota bacterium]